MNPKQVILVFLLSMLPACSDQGSTSIDLEHRQLWESLSIHHYTIDQRRDCFRCPNGGRIVQIVVRADTIASISAIDSLQPPIQSGPYLTIDSLFGFIEWARTLPSANIQVSYHAQYGYPERIILDPVPNAVDDEIAYTTSHFGAIR
jgi:hypothetical protein